MLQARSLIILLLLLLGDLALVYLLLSSSTWNVDLLSKELGEGPCSCSSSKGFVIDSNSSVGSLVVVGTSSSRSSKGFEYELGFGFWTPLGCRISSSSASSKGFEFCVTGKMLVFFICAAWISSSSEEESNGFLAPDLNPPSAASPTFEYAISLRRESPVLICLLFLASLPDKPHNNSEKIKLINRKHNFFLLSFFRFPVIQAACNSEVSAFLLSSWIELFLLHISRSKQSERNPNCLSSDRVKRGAFTANEFKGGILSHNLSLLHSFLLATARTTSRQQQKNPT